MASMKYDTRASEFCVVVWYTLYTRREEHRRKVSMAYECPASMHGIKRTFGGMLEAQFTAVGDEYGTFPSRQQASPRKPTGFCRPFCCSMSFLTAEIWKSKR